MKIYNDSIENAVGVNSTFFGQYIGSAYSYITPPLNGLIIQGNVGIGTTAPTQNLHIQGALRLTGALYDSSNSLGVANQVLSSTGTGVAWTSVSASGGSISGSGTVNFVPKFNTTSSLTNSNISDTGSLITLGVAVSANNQISINVPLGGTSIINTVNGSGLILQGRGTVGDPAALRIVGNDATIYADAVDTAYFQADYKNLRNLVLLSGTYGNDVPLNRLLLNTRQVTIWDGSHTSAPVPTSLFEVANGFAATKVNFKIIGTSAQTADFFQVYSSTLARNIFVIDASGNVGIGTTAPSQALHIQNNLRLTGRLFDTNNLSGTSNQLLASTGSAVTWVNGMIGSITANQVAFANANNVLTGVSTFVLTSTGLGINTTAPLSNLNVWAGSGTTTVFRVDSNSGLLFQITNSLTGTLFAVNNISGLSNFFVTDGVQNPLVNVNAPVGISSQIISVTSASNAPFFSITGLGSVGIATSSPTQNLHVQGNTRITGGIFDSLNQIGLAGSVLSSTGTGLAWTAQSTSAATLSGSGAANQVTFWSGANSLRGISTFVYQNGALGIGTSSPRGALETTNEIYVENIYIGAGNSFTNTIVGLGVSFYSTGAIADLDYTTVLGYRANATSDPLPGIIIGSEAVTNTSYASANAFQKHILIGNNVHSDLNIRFDGSPPGKTIIGHSAYRYIDNSDDRDSANLIIIGEEAYSGTATTYLADENQNVIIGNYASKSANFNLSLIIGHGAGQAFDFSTPASARESNIIIGNSAAQNLTGTNNVLIGAGVANTSSLGIYNNNVALGHYNNIAAADYQIALGPNVNTVRANAGAWGGNTNVTRTDLGIGTFAPLSRLHLETLSSSNMGLLINGSTSQTADLLEVNATTTGANFFTITGIGSVGIYTSAPTQALHVRGNARITGGIFDSNNQIGLANSVLISTGTGISWTSQLSNILTGTGTINTVAKFSSATTLSNSNIIDTGTLITLGSGVTVSGILTSFGFFGPGTNITNLNASNLASGTVPSAVVSGSYSGITSVGNLTQLNVTGITSTVNLRISGILYDNSFSSGTQNQILSSTGTAISWTTINSVGIITGTGTLNTIPKFAGPASLTTSNITDNGIAVTINSRLNVVGIGSFTNDLLVNNITVGLGSGQITSNTALGLSALAANTTGNLNVAIGSQAGLANTNGIENTFVGNQAGRTNNAGNSNTAVGYLAMFANTSGAQNAALGRSALVNNTTGTNNSALGYAALNSNTTGSNNTALGFLALQNNVTTSGNTGLGRDALRYYANSSNQTAVGFAALQGNGTVALNIGTQNSALGYQAGVANTSGSNNVFIGYQAGLANTSGSQNVFLGRVSGSTILTGSNNTFLGDSTGGNIAASYQIAVGQAVVPTASNLGAWGGNTNATRTDLGVGTFTPLARLHVESLNAANAGLIVAGAASQTANLLEVELTTNGVTAMVVTGVGSVGINTATARYPLHVVGAARVSNLGIGVAPQASSILDVAGNINMSPGGAYRWGNGDAQISNNSGQYNIVLTNYNGTFSQENMRLVSSGLVGIGTNSPATKLHVRSGFTTNTAFRISGLTGQIADLLQIESAIAGTRFVTVGAAGSVGIGTTTPSQPLHVQGTARFNGSILDNNNLPGAAIGIVSQVLTSTGVGVTWAPIKRNLVVPLMTAFNPTLVGIDSAVFIVPQDPINGTSSMTFNFRRVNVRVETPSAAGITTINIAKSISAGAFLGTNILTTSINLTGASTYEGFSTSFAAGFTTAASGDKLAINFVGVNTFHQNLTVELIAIEA